MASILFAALLSTIPLRPVALEAISSPAAWVGWSSLPASGEEPAGFTPFDCAAGVSDWAQSWSPSKKAWCCEHKHVGCNDTPRPRPFDCDAGVAAWQTGWSAAKKDWCCTSRGVGCPRAAQLAAAQQLAAAHRAHAAPRYVFVGYGNAHDARKVCRNHGGMPMPKTESEQNALQETVNAAVREGHLTHTWPNNTFWLGASWDKESRHWKWDDGSAVGMHRAAAANLEGLGASSRDNQSNEPWLCQMLDGMWHDSLPVHPFGIICERRGESTSTFTTTSTTSTATRTATTTLTTSRTVTTKTVTTSSTSTTSRSTTSSTTTSSTSLTTSISITGTDTTTTTTTIMSMIAATTAHEETAATAMYTTRSATSTTTAFPGWSWLEFNPSKLRGGQASDHAQLSEIWFRWNGSAVNMSNATVSFPGGFSSDGHVTGPLRMQLPRVTQVDAFGFTTARDRPSRDPVQWTLKGSRDGVHWAFLHRQDVDYATPLSRRTATMPIALARPDEIAWAANSVTTTGDFSLNKRNKVIGGAVGGSVGAIAVGLVGGLLGGLLTEPATTAMPNDWASTTTTASTAQIAFIREPTSGPAGPRFLGDGSPAATGAFAQGWMWVVAIAALSAIACAFVGFHPRARGVRQGCREVSSAIVTVEESDDGDEEQGRHCDREVSSAIVTEATEQTEHESDEEHESDIQSDGEASVASLPFLPGSESMMEMQPKLPSRSMAAATAPAYAPLPPPVALSPLGMANRPSQCGMSPSSPVATPLLGHRAISPVPPHSVHGATSPSPPPPGHGALSPRAPGPLSASMAMSTSLAPRQRSPSPSPRPAHGAMSSPFPVPAWANGRPAIAPVKHAPMPMQQMSPTPAPAPVTRAWSGSPRTNVTFAD